MRHGPTNVAQDGTERRASPRPTGPHAVTHPLPPRLIIFSHPHIPTQTPHTQKISPGASIPSPLAYTHSREWNLLSWRHIRLSLSRPLSFLVLSLPRPPCRPLYPCLSRIRNTHTYLSRPRQMHQLHIHTCYITYPIDLKSPLFTFISHTTFLLNKVWPKNYFRVSTYIQHYKVIWRSTNANLHCMVPTMIFIPHCEFVYFYTIYKVSHNKEKRRASLSPSHTPLYAPFTYAHKTISRSSKSKPPENSRMFHLSLAIYAMTIIVFEAKARYVHWTSESTHYGHHLRLVVIIQSRAHRTTLYLLMTWLVDQLNAPRGTSSVASHYLTTIVPTCRLVSTLHLHSYKIHKIHSYKKQSWWWWCACHPAI